MVAEGTEERVVALRPEAMTSAMVILPKETDESGSDAVVYGMVRRLFLRQVVQSSALLSFQADGEGSLHGMVDALGSLEPRYR